MATCFDHIVIYPRPTFNTKNIYMLKS